MAIESRNSQGADPNYRKLRQVERDAAQESLRKAKFHLDNTMRGTESAEGRTLVSTIYNLVREAEDLTKLLEQIDNTFE